MPLRVILLLCICSFCQETSSQSALQYCDEANLKSQVDHLKEMLYQNHSNSGIKEADEILAVLASRKMLNCEIALWTYWCKGEAFEYKNQGHLAIEQYHKIIPLAKKHAFYEVLAETFISLERVHEASGRRNDAKRYLDKAQELIEEHQLDFLRPRLFMRASSYYRIYEERQDTAMLLAQSAIDLGRKYKVVRPQTDGHMLMGMMVKDPLQRMVHFKAAKEVFVRNKAYHGATTMSNSIARLYLELDSIEKAKQAAVESFAFETKLTKELGYREYYNHRAMRGAHAVLQGAFEKERNMDSAYYHLQKVAEYTSKIQFNTNQDKINEIEFQFAIENEILKSKALEDRLQRTKTVMFYISFTSILLLSLFLFALRNRKKRIAQNVLISQQNESLNILTKRQEVLLSEVHHRVKNNLQNVISLLMLQRHKTEDRNQKDYLSDISNKIHSIALVHDHLYRDREFEQINLEKYFEDLFSHYADFNGNPNKIRYAIESNFIHLNIETVIPLGIICAELLTNSLKHIEAQENLLKIQLVLTKEKKGLYKFSYSDNGYGFPRKVLDGKSKGMGIVLIKSMTRQLKGTLNMFNNNGAVVEIEFLEKVISKI